MSSVIALLVIVGIVAAAIVVTRRGKEEAAALRREDELATHDVTATVDVPVEAEVDGTWHRGRLTSFRQEQTAWFGYVEVDDPAIPAAWYERDRVRTLDAEE